MDESLRVENTLDLQKLVLRSIAEGDNKMAVISVTSCHTGSCTGSQLEALQRLPQNVKT